MKNFITIISLLTLTIFLFTSQNVKSLSVFKSKNDSVKVWSSQELTGIAAIWINEYLKDNPNEKIQHNTSKIENISDNIKTDGNVGFVNKFQLSEMKVKPVWSLALARDVIVPVMNSKNPYLDQILSKGLSPEDFEKVYTNQEKLPWGLLLDDKYSSPVNAYYSGDVSSKYYLSDFMKISQRQLLNKSVLNYDMMFKLMQEDVFAIGFCKLVDVIDHENQEVDNRLVVIPIDMNGNNQIDYKEDIYSNLSIINNSIWLGRYPYSLYGNIYAVANYTLNNREIAFMEWIITNGQQQYLFDEGYLTLSNRESQIKVHKLFDSNHVVAKTNDKPMISTTIIFISIVGVVFSVLIYLIFSKKRTISQNGPVEEFITPTVFSENSLTAPRGLYYDKSHTWAFMERNGLVKIGIDDFLLNVTGNINHIKMKNPDEKIKKGEPVITIIQNGKQLKINSPISGTIKRCNIDINNDISTINDSPYYNGWIYSVEPSNWYRDVQFLSTVDNYKVWLKNEFTRLKDFLTNIKIANTFGLESTILQDGGDLERGILQKLRAEIWEDFQSYFIDIVK